MSTDWTISQALGGGQITGQLHDIRARYEALLNNSLANVKAKRAEAAHLMPDQSALTDGGYDPAIDVEALIALRLLTLPQRIHDYEAAVREENAYRMRHGLTRAPR